MEDGRSGFGEAVERCEVEVIIVFAWRFAMSFVASETLRIRFLNIVKFISKAASASAYQ